jgi:hypothetical protein
MTELRVTISDDLAEQLAAEAAERGTSAENLAADLLRKHVRPSRERSLSFIGMFEGVPGAPSVAELERRLEDGEDDEFGQ